MNPKVIVITGASSGIGAALAKELGSKGHRLVVGARRGKELKEVAAHAGTEALPVVVDVTRRQDIERLRDAAIEKFDHVDVWVNNAGRGSGHTVMELSEKELDEMIDVNLKSVFYGMKVIVPHFQKRGEGHLINVSSFLGRVPLATYRSAYNAAKAAANTLTANLRMDLRMKYPKVHVSLVMAGFVDTDFHKVAGTPFPVKAGTRVGEAVVQSAEEVAGQIASLIEHPVAELYTNPGLRDLAVRYYQDVGAFEERMGQR
ncbi:MAG: SDR family oxidoreductase [Candidatus Bathyarchaeia archaeon]|jgi:NADP-dependent 3-hydroxy acid dehydrogenase YdfG